MDAETIKAERSRLLNRQKKDRAELEKTVKTKKGAFKQAAQEELAKLEAEQERELAEFDRTSGHGPSSPAPKIAEKNEDKSPSSKPKKSKGKKNLPIDVEWSDLSKRELQEECHLRGLSKGGGREELVSRLIDWAMDRKAKLKNGGGVEVEEASSSEESSSEDDSSSDESESSSDEDDIPDMTDTQKEEAEKQYKRELIVRKAILHLFETKFPDGFPLEDLPENLARIKVMNFKPESLGYTSLHEFARKQPRDALFYDKGEKWLKPIKFDKRPDRSGGKGRK